MLRRLAQFAIALLVPVLAYALEPLQKDIPYGSDKEQKLDVYAPAQVKDAPVIVMVHGGAWRLGDKAYGCTVEPKATDYLAHGYIFVSVNYRMRDAVTPLTQAEDVAAAVNYVRAHAVEWGGNAQRMVLMGHSAGGHLVTLLSANPAHFGLKPWRGTISLDSAAMNVETIMQAEHRAFYDEAFGKDPTLWRKVSPYYRLVKGGVPMLLVCSTRREEESCGQAAVFAKKALQLGGQTTVRPEDLSHRDINCALGTKSAYTDAVDGFITQKLN